MATIYAHRDVLYLDFRFKGQRCRERTGLPDSELNRRKEPLEAFPLDSMSMVGSVSKQGVPYALLKVDGSLPRTREGRAHARAAYVDGCAALDLEGRRCVIDARTISAVDECFADASHLRGG